jgi:catechol 2,3-dioxygenase-like lactoylglutathione lyase family enzyme
VNGPLHHVSLGVTDLDRAARFYDAVLEPLGLVRVWEETSAVEAAIGYGPPGQPDVIALKQRPAAQPPGPGFHLALSAPDRDAVERFHAAALAHGGSDEGAPGVRPHYGPEYFAAFVSDPDGHRLEAVIIGGYRPEGGQC